MKESVLVYFSQFPMVFYRFKMSTVFYMEINWLFVKLHVFSLVYLRITWGHLIWKTFLI